MDPTGSTTIIEKAYRGKRLLVWLREMNIWSKRNSFALIVAGSALMLAGWKWSETGDVVYFLPEWVMTLGGAIVTIGIYTYALSLTQK